MKSICSKEKRQPNFRAGDDLNCEKMTILRAHAVLGPDKVLL
jgi:hypothetical protein